MTECQVSSLAQRIKVAYIYVQLYRMDIAQEVVYERYRTIAPINL
jgi:hypothetical protein